MPNYKYLIITDLDGTLLNRDEQISEQTLKYVHELNERDDVLFTFNTGRPWFESKDIYDKLKLKGFVSCCNGAVIYNPHSTEISYSYISRKFAIDILSSPMMAIDLCVGHILTNKRVYEFNQENLLSVTSQLEKDDADVYGIKLYFKEDCPIFNEKLQMLKEFRPELRVTIFKHPGVQNIEIQAGYVQKEKATIFLAHYYGVEYHNILTFGDNFNDISVMEGVSRSYAVDNAALQIKSYAKNVSKFSNDKDAVINEVKAFLDSAA